MPAPLGPAATRRSATASPHHERVPTPPRAAQRRPRSNAPAPWPPPIGLPHPNPAPNPDTRGQCPADPQRTADSQQSDQMFDLPPVRTMTPPTAPPAAARPPPPKWPPPCPTPAGAHPSTSPATRNPTGLAPAPRNPHPGPTPNPLGSGRSSAVATNSLPPRPPHDLAPVRNVAPTRRPHPKTPAVIPPQSHVAVHPISRSGTVNPPPQPPRCRHPAAGSRSPGADPTPQP